MHYSKNEIQSKYLFISIIKKTKILTLFFFIFIHCLKNVIKIIIEHNRDLQWWFEDIGKTLLSLVVEARDCATYSGSERTFVLFCLFISIFL